MSTCWGRTGVWRLLMLAGFALALSACSDHALGNLGRSSEWLAEVKPTAVTSTVVPVDPIRSVELVGWWNLGLGGDLSEDPEDTVARVYQRGGDGGRFVQASPYEIASALPGVVFPSLVPGDVTSITSQLVYVPGRPVLDPDQSAVFGLWTVEPYSRSRIVGQRGVLAVRPWNDAEEVSCASLADTETISCRTDFVGDQTVWRIVDARGETWVWIEAGYRYDLFLRDDVTPVADMVGSTVPLVELLAGTGVSTG